MGYQADRYRWLGSWSIAWLCAFLSACWEAEPPASPPEIAHVRNPWRRQPEFFVYGMEITAEFDRDPGLVQVTYNGAVGPSAIGEGTERVFAVLGEEVTLTWDGGTADFEYYPLFEPDHGPMLASTRPPADGTPILASVANTEGIALHYDAPLWDPDRVFQLWEFTVEVTNSRGVVWNPDLTHEGRDVVVRPPAGQAFQAGETYTITAMGGLVHRGWFPFSDEITFTFE